MILSGESVAFGASGIEPRWTSSAKEGLGTAYHTGCRLWFTVSHGIGQKETGSAYDRTGVGRLWPILTGERGHYELAAGRDPMRFVSAMEEFANEGGMITEHLWDTDDLPDRSMKRGRPTGAAMPLCWSHAEYLTLVRSWRDGICFDRVEPAFQR